MSIIASADSTKHDIICRQEHRFIHEEFATKQHIFGSWRLITCSAWKNSLNAATGGTGMLFSPQAYNALISAEMITPRNMIVTLNGNLQTTIISCYSPTNVSDETEVDTFYEDLIAVTRQVPKNNIIIIAGHFNAHLGQLDGFKYAYHTQTNRNGSKLKAYINENNLLCLNTKYQKRTGQLWTHKSPNGRKAQLEYVIINRKWKNSAKSCRAFNSFVSVASDHRVVSTQIRLSLRANREKNSDTSPYDWTHLKDNPEIRNTFIIRVKNRFAALQDTTLTNSTNTKYNHSIKKQTPWETDEICQKSKQLHEAAKLKDSQPTPENFRNFINARDALKETYEAEQSEYLQRNINHITNAVDNQRSAIAWKTVNEIRGRKSSNRGKLKASNQDERVKLWHQHFQDLLGKPPVIKEEEMTPVSTEDLNIKKGLFTIEELLKAVKNIQFGKASGLDEIPAEVWKIDDIH